MKLHNVSCNYLLYSGELFHDRIFLFFTARKRSLGQGNVFAPVSHFINRRDLCPEGISVCGYLSGGVSIPGVSVMETPLV